MNDKVIGFIMSLIGAAGIIVEFYLLIIMPLVGDVIGDMSMAQWWALAIPIFLGVFGVLGILLWIGLTMIRTPPPESWDFEEDEDQEIAS